MSTVKLKYIQGFVDRHGRARWYFRRLGCKRLPLPGLPGSPEFMEAYQDAVAGAPRIAPKARVVKQGTFDDLATKYFASAAFQGLPSPATRQTYRGIIEGFCNLRCGKGQRYAESESRTGGPRTSSTCSPKSSRLLPPPTIGCAC